MPVITFTSAGEASPESGGPVTITAEIDVVDVANVVLPFTLSGTAVLTTDYTITASPVTITPGLLSVPIIITPVNNLLNIGNKTVIVTMGTPTNATVGAIDEFTLIITEDDAIPVYPTLTPNQITDLGLTFPVIKTFFATKQSDGTYTVQTCVIQDGKIKSVTNANGYTTAALAKTAINLLTAAYIDALV